MDAKYSIVGTLNAFDQLNIARKLSPAMPVVDGMVRKENAGKDKSILVTLALGMLSDENSDYVVNKCVSLAVRSEPGIPPSKVMVNGKIMFDDIKLQDLIDITAKVIEDNLGDFLSTALSD